VSSPVSLPLVGTVTHSAQLRHVQPQPLEREERTRSAMVEDEPTPEPLDRLSHGQRFQVVKDDIPEGRCVAKLQQAYRHGTRELPCELE